MRTALLFCISWVSLTGCPSTPTISFESLNAEWAQASCSYNVRCELAANQQTCVDLAKSNPPQALIPDGTIANSVAAKRIKYDGAAASRCLQKMEKASCIGGFGEGFGSDPDCQTIFVGQLKEGATCNLFECHSGLACAFPADTLWCGGTCKIPVKLGGEAKTYLECEPGLDLRDGKCAPAGKEGEICRAVCEAGLLCSIGKCAKPAALGEACDSTEKFCRSDLDCVASKCEKLKQLNESCEGAHCQIGLRCDVDVKPFQCKSLLKEGEVCPHYGCEPTLRCLKAPPPSINYTCQKPATLNQKCQLNGCEDGLYCSAPSLTCKKTLEIGSDCEPTQTQQCGTGRCVGGKCEADVNSCK